MEGREDLLEECRNKLLPTFQTSCCFWMPAQVLFFRVPTRSNVVFGCLHTAQVFFFRVKCTYPPSQISRLSDWRWLVSVAVWKFFSSGAQLCICPATVQGDLYCHLQVRQALSLSFSWFSMTSFSRGKDETLCKPAHFCSLSFLWFLMKCPPQFALGEHSVHHQEGFRHGGKVASRHLYG